MRFRHAAVRADREPRRRTLKQQKLRLAEIDRRLEATKPPISAETRAQLLQARALLLKEITG